MRFRPCIDLHGGQVKQIVGSTLSDDQSSSLKTNFASDKSPLFYAEMYKRDGLVGGHVIKLGSGNDQAALEALQAYPGGLQVGGGINAKNAAYWLDQGASHVIITSYVFEKGRVREDRLLEVLQAVGKGRLVLDLSCRKKGGKYYVVTDRWQNFTDMEVNGETLKYFAKFCDEFLVHAVDVEGKCSGIEQELAVNLGKWTTLPTTYAGGIQSMNDMYLIKELGAGKLDATIGSALDIFGGNGVTYTDAVAFDKAERS
ncbi:MAG: phosphoribosylformimino-5-aminoimidazole carboxamide ribotide isomerase [Proteobacteria bacterium]|nr:phosphoribosylformimino-5-aminoimidazole carboxamide ribotide isomerase [Pseudomonadota bacterium]MBU1710824.1 phosphoribosylformimino-5-aminoimidazole carboxamide ribotide isomerase [Pseudomonadota bacterium]